MGHNSFRRRESGARRCNNRVLRLEPLEPRIALAAAAPHFLGLVDAALAAYVKGLSADGSINRADMINILRKAEQEPGGFVHASELMDLRKIVQDAPVLKMPDYVAVLAGDVVNRNRANAHYQDKLLGNLAAGDPCTKLKKLTDKWFYGADLPSTTYGYTRTLGTLYSSAGPSHRDEKQGDLSDCYLIAALGSIADNSQKAIKNMLIYNGDGTWTVRFYYHSKADYVTVDRELPSDKKTGTLVYDGSGSRCSDPNNVLWMSLLEKAYVEWNETGKTERSNASNKYTTIEYGWPENVFQQALGYCSISFLSPSASDARTKLIDSVNKHYAVTICTNKTVDPSTKLVRNHCYSVLSYDSATGTFTLYNPWGDHQPNPLTWAQFQANVNDIAAVAYAGLYAEGLRCRSAVAASNASMTSVTCTLSAGAGASRAATDAAIVDWDTWSIHVLPIWPPSAFR